MKYTDYIVGKTYRYSEIPDEGNDNEDITVNDYGPEYLGQNGIHIRYHKSEKDVWFIYERQGNEGFFKCVYNN